MPDVEAAVTALESKIDEAYPDQTNPYLHWQTNGYWSNGAFCDAFAQWGMVEMGGFRWPETSQWGYKGASYCPYTVENAKQMGVWHGPHDDKYRGWQVLFSWNRNGVADHIETIVEVYGDGSFTTIAGNVGNGDINYVWRDLYYVMGFVQFDDSTNPYVPVQPPANYNAPSNPYLCWLVTSPYMSGPDIRWSQDFMNTCCSQNLDLDGIYGPLTRSSVINFQRFFSLLIDGIVGPETYDCMRYIAALNGF